MNKKDSSNTPKRAWWKIAALAVGIVLVLTATTYALVTRQSSASSGTLSQGAAPPVAATTASAPATMGIGDLKWAKNVTTKFADNDFIFVVLPGSDSTTEVLTNRVADAAAKIEAKAARVETITLSASDPEFSITKERLAISQLPAILAISSTGNGAILTGDITEAKLLQAYLVVSQPICPPGSSSGCCPK
jgi:hypothetical protein